MKAALAVLLAALALAGPLWAETTTEAPTEAARTVEAGGALLRLLDRMTGQVSDATLAKGQAQDLGRLTITMDECRYPEDLPLGEAFAHLTITDPDLPEPIYKGWMIASSPALSALDHQRYDVWVLHCDVPVQSTSEGEGSGG